MKIKLLALILNYALYKLIVRIFIKINKFLIPKKYKKKIGIAIYKNLILNKNIEIKDYELFYERFITPQIFY